MEKSMLPLYKIQFNEFLLWGNIFDCGNQKNERFVSVILWALDSVLTFPCKTPSHQVIVIFSMMIKSSSSSQWWSSHQHLSQWPRDRMRESGENLGLRLSDDCCSHHQLRTKLAKTVSNYFGWCSILETLLSATFCILKRNERTKSFHRFETFWGANFCVVLWCAHWIEDRICLAGLCKPYPPFSGYLHLTLLFWHGSSRCLFFFVFVFVFFTVKHKTSKSIM